MNSFVAQGNTFTPPKWIQHKREEEATVLLEDRLFHFIEWLRDENIYLSTDNTKIREEEDIKQIIKDYVES